MPNSKRQLSFEERQKFPYQSKNKNQQNNTTNSQENATNPLSKYLTLTDEKRFLNQQNKINAKYDSQINNLNLGKTTQQQQADITRSQLQKYLPYYYKSKGLSGLGLEQSAMLDANANYTNQLGQIENNFAQQKNALENYRQDDLMKAENDYLANIDKNSMSAYNEVTNPLEMYIADEKLTNDEYNKVKTTLDLYRDQMTPTDIKMAENLLENYKTQFGEEQTETNKNLIDEKNITDNVLQAKDYLTIGNNRYLVADHLDNKSRMITDNNHFDALLKAKGYASAYDSHIPNGTIFEVQGGKGNGSGIKYRNVNKYEIEEINGEKQVKNKVLGPGNPTYTVAYMNGEWYVIEKQ